MSVMVYDGTVPEVVIMCSLLSMVLCVNEAREMLNVAKALWEDVAGQWPSKSELVAEAEIKGWQASGSELF
eukprot:5330139-Amphidinium_carterae.1